MREGKTITRTGRGITTIVVLVLLFGTLLPLFGNTAQASEEVTSVTSEISGPEPLGTDPNQITVFGTLRYVDRDVSGNRIKDASGNDITLPIRNAWVQIYRNWGPVEANTYTNISGYFEVSFTPSSSATEEYYAMIVASSNYSDVINFEGDGMWFANVSDNVSASPGNRVELTFSSYPDHPAWNILDSVTEAAEWVKVRTGGWSRPKISIYYPTAQSVFIFLSGSSVDWIDISTDDGWKDHTACHEYAHAIMYYLYGNAIPAGNDGRAHNLNLENTLEFAVKEGWAELFEFIIGNGSLGVWWLNGPGTETRGQDIEYAERINGSYNPSQNYKDWWGVDSNNDGLIERDKVEGNIVGILYDIFDSAETNDWYFPVDSSNSLYPSCSPYDDDGLALGFGPIWDVMANKKPFTIYEFWDGWFQYSGHASTAHDKHWIKSIYFNHGIDPGSSNIASAYRLPQTAPLITDFQITSTGPYNDNKWIDYKLKLSDEAEDQNFLRVRLEYESAPGVWIQFHEVENTLMLRDGDYYTDNVLASAIAVKGGDGTWNIHAVVDDDMLETISTNTLSVVIDNTKPTSSATRSGAYWRNTSPISISATASDINGIKAVTLRYRYSADNATWGPWTNYATDTAASWEWSFTWPAGRGYYEFHTIATDNAGNIEAEKTAAEAAYFYIYPPSGNIYINGDVSQTTSRNTNIDLSNIVTFGTSQMRFANDLNYDWGTNYWTIQSQHPVEPGYTRSIELAGTPETTKMKVHFERIDIKNNVDFIYIKNAQGNILASYTGSYPSGVEWASSTADGNINWIEIYIYIGSHEDEIDYYGFKIDRYSYYTQRWSNWETFSASKAWTLSPGYGEKTVYCQITDVGGNDGAFQHATKCFHKLFMIRSLYIPG